MIKAKGMMTALKIWKTKSSDDNFARRLVDELKLPPILANVLSGYGFADIETVERFLDPRLKDVSDPFLIPQMDKAVRRIWRAVTAKEKMLVFGDYDVDGVVGTVLLVKILLRLGAQCVLPCLPDRREDGYGLTIAALQRCFRQAKPDLIITVDCGINALEAAEFIKKEGIDLIITDHHELGPALPDAVAVVNPKLAGSDTMKMLAGVGVAFKLCHALLKHGQKEKNTGADFDLREYLDLVALGTVADIVPLLDENRIFVRYGLAQINGSNALAWRALKEVASLNGKLDTYHLAYCIAPRLNAAGRLNSAETALELFLTEDENRAKSIAKQLDDVNRERQEIEAKILEEAVEEVNGYFTPEIHYGIVIGRRGWHVGVIGIVASRLVARYHRPVIVIGFDEQGAGRGSSRSIEGYNILNGLNECRNVLTAFGGHAMAAGLEMEEKNYTQFQKLFNQAAERELKEKNLAPVQTVNAWSKLSDVSDENFEALEKLAPFGQNNPKPVFAVRGVKVAGSPRIVGKKHLRFSVSDGKITVGAIAFNHAGSVINRAEGATSPAGSAPGMPERNIPAGLIDIAFRIQKNLSYLPSHRHDASRDSFIGAENLELNILDYRKTSPAAKD
ncbi:MAG: single-stranded-DNA-specific exonuclease RecJ [Kiritimatiellia bacterium]|nr:single-stranded-DNA-specific exonuclease RecJ [Kiritimatiellia bacterium]